MKQPRVNVQAGKFSICPNMATEKGFAPYCSDKDWRYLIRINDPNLDLFTLDELEEVGNQIMCLVKAARLKIAKNVKI